MADNLKIEGRITLQRNSALPLYAQLANDIRRLILTEEWGPSQRIPSESSLTAELGVSRNTVRLALQTIENEGLITRQAGRGSFVAGRLGGMILHRFIGFLAPYSQDLLPGRVLIGVQRVAHDQGYHVAFGDSVGRLSQENSLLEKLDREGIRNYIIWPASESNQPRYLRQLVDRGYSIVQVDRALPGLNASFVGSDNVGGGRAATKHLIELGHERIAFLVHGGLDISSVRERREGYQQAMSEGGLVPLSPITLPYRKEVHFFESGLNALDQQTEKIEHLASQLRRPDRPTAIFAMNDLVAYQALKAAERAGLSVPKDLAVVGFDDTDFCERLEITLTSVHQDLVGIGRTACRLLIRQVEGLRHRPATRRLPVHVVARESTVGSAGRNGAR